MKTPLLSIVIVKYHCEKFLSACLKSLGESPLWETILVDNDENNIGYGAGCNKGAEKAKGKYLLFLNPDTEVLPGTLEKMIDFIEKNSQVGILGGQLYADKKGTKQLCFCRFPDPLTTLFVFSPLKNVWKNSPLWERYIYYQDKKPAVVQEVDAVSGAALMIKKDLFEKLGGYDERFFLYFEENNLCRRAKLTGAKVFFLPEAGIIHFGQKSTLDLAAAGQHFRRSRSWFFHKHYGAFLGAVLDQLIAVMERGKDE